MTEAEQAQEHLREAPETDAQADRVVQYPPGSDRASAALPRDAARDPGELIAVLAQIWTDWERPLAPLRAVRPSAGGKGATPRSRPLVPLAVSDARAEVATSLFGWCAVLVEDRALVHALVRQNDVPGMCGLLARHVEWWTRHEAWGDLIGELTDRGERLHRLVTPSRSATVRIGTCPLVDVHDRPCGGLVLADPADLIARCRQCGTTEGVDWWRGIIAVPEFVTVRELARLAAVDGIELSEHAIRGLIDRDVVEVAGHDARGRRLVHRGDALAALRANLERRGLIG